MGDLSIGQIVLARFPFSDLTSKKLRPCLVIGLAEFQAILLCQITSKPYGSKRAIPLSKHNFKTGTIALNSFIRPDKIATLDQNLIVRTLGTLSTAKLSEVKIAISKVLELER